MRLLVTDGRDERLRETGMYFVRRIDDAGRVLGEWGRRGAGLRLTWFAQCACACACARGIPACARSCVRVHSRFLGPVCVCLSLCPLRRGCACVTANVFDSPARS